MRRAIAVLLCLAAGCATASSDSDLKKAVTKAWGDCIMAAVQRFDDGKSDPASMAYGIAPKCAVEYNQLTEAMVQEYWTQVGQIHMRAQMADNEGKLTTSAILTWRNRDKK